MRIHLALVTMAAIALASPRQATLAQTGKPTLYLVGDSTVNVGTTGQVGWGERIAEYFDPAKVAVVNAARGGRSSRTFLTEGLWARVLTDLRRGDVVIVQFGHNDGSALFDTDRPRGSIRGTGEEIEAGTVELTGEWEEVHSFGWYVRKYVADARAKGATVIVCSPIPRNVWREARVVREEYRDWARAAAASSGAPFIDLTEIIARRYEQLGPERVSAFFPADQTHTNQAGADINAASVIAGLKGLEHCGGLCGFFSPKAADVAAWSNPQPPLPKEWLDAQTGHRIVRLTGDAGGSTLYFHDNAFSPQGDTLMFSTPDGIASVDVATIGAGGARLEIVTGHARSGYFSRRTREVYYGGNGRGSETVSAFNIDTRQARELPHARGLINAAETLSVVKNGAAVDPDGRHAPPPVRPVLPQLRRMFPGRTMDELTPDQQFSVTKEDRLAARAINPALQSFVFTDLQTGQSLETGFQYGDLNHLQFNPVDPDLLLYCHEGTWHEVDRTWTIRADGSRMQLLHQRVADMDINGHEWWSWDGRTVWFDLQTPRSQDFWIAGVNVATGRTTRYHLERSWWGVHFNSSRDDTLFASDGGDASQVAYATDGMWINLLRVQRDGTVTREKLVDMSRHNYVTGQGGVEPNVHITPDKRWVVFTGQFAQGQRHVYAVEIAKTR